LWETNIEDAPVTVVPHEVLPVQLEQLLSRVGRNPRLAGDYVERGVSPLALNPHWSIISVMSGPCFGAELDLVEVPRAGDRAGDQVRDTFVHEEPHTRIVVAWLVAELEVEVAVVAATGT
jgi:hypothetical protein